MMHLNSHLTFNGQCQAAFEYYEKHLGGKVSFMMTYGDSPMAAQSSPEWRKKIIHASFALGSQILTGADSPPEIYRKPQGLSVLLSVDNAEDAAHVYTALSGKGTVQMQLQETFWALRFAMVVDQFGTPWMINCARPA